MVIFLLRVHIDYSERLTKAIREVKAQIEYSRNIFGESCGGYICLIRLSVFLESLQKWLTHKAQLDEEVSMGAVVFFVARNMKTLFMHFWIAQL